MIALWASHVLLLVSVGLACLCTIGVIGARDTFDRIHFVTPVTTAAAVGVGLAVALDRGLEPATGKVAMVVVALFVTSPLLTHVLAVAAKRRRDLQAREREQRRRDA